MAITISKKKPLVLKSQGDEAVEAGAPLTFAPPDFSAAAREPSYTLYGILSIVSVLLVAALLLFQWLEMQEYNKPPAAFPQPGVAAAP